jgi:hypothetical protein
LHRETSLVDNRFHFCNLSKLKVIQEWSKDAYLLVHYSNYTSTTIPFFVHSEKDVWKSRMPVAAADNPSLMHGLMAFSALHLAYLEPHARSKWKMLAFRHQNVALGLLRTALPTINPHNVHAITGLSILLCASSITTTQDSLDCSTPVNDIIQVFNLHRVIGKAITVYKDMIMQGPMPLMVGQWKARCSDFSLPDHEEQKFDLLYDLNNYHHAQSPLAHSIIEVAIDSLKDIYSDVVSWKSPVHRNAVASWPVHIENQYVDLLFEKDPVALVVFAHFFALSRTDFESPWFMSGWIDRSLASISDALPDEWRQWMDLDYPPQRLQIETQAVEMKIELQPQIQELIRDTEVQGCPSKVTADPGVPAAKEQPVQEDNHITVNIEQYPGQSWREPRLAGYDEQVRMKEIEASPELMAGVSIFSC